MKHQKFLQIIGFLTFLGTFLPLKSQDLPNPIHSRKYYYNHFDYPLNGIRISTNNAFSKWLNEQYFEPTNIAGKIVNIHQPWGHDSIQQIVKSFEISPFYCALSEVTNSEYQKFVNDDTSSFFKRQKLSRAWVYPDTNVWVSALTFNEPFVNYYFQHPAYSDFPVVGVSQFQATQYCNWLEDKLNAEFKGQLPEGYKIQVDLPTSAEFVQSSEAMAKHFYATLSKKEKELLSKYFARVPYKPLFGSSKYYATIHAFNNQINFGQLRDERLTFVLDKNYLITNSVFPKNLANTELLGNVAEWTSSRATSKLYNDLEWVLTLPSVEGNGEGKLIPNPDYTVPQEKLSGILYKESDLWQYFAVKGGSWADEFHYLNPEAVQIHRGDYRSAKIGFRTVIRIVRGQ